MILPMSAPYTDPLTVLICGGSNFGIALDNCVNIQPEVDEPQWVLERMVCTFSSASKCFSHVCGCAAFAACHDMHGKFCVHLPSIFTHNFPTLEFTGWYVLQGQ